MSACLELRVYTQQALACDHNATGDALAGQVGAWRSWWNASRAKFTLKTHQARLDLANMYRVRPITIGEHFSR
jgi:hypothetical protein